MQHSLSYNWKHHLKLFGLVGAIKPGKKEGHSFILQMIEDGSARYLIAFLCSFDLKQFIIANNLLFPTQW